MISKEEFLRIVESRYDAINALDDGRDFYDYEKAFASIVQEMNRALLESSIGPVPKDRRKKKTLSQFGYIQLAKSHPYSEFAKGFGISPLMQERMVFAGQYDNYGSCNQLIDKLMDLEVSSAQVYRVTNVYGSELDMSDQSERSLAPLQRQEVLYAEADGSMILTRDGWKEVKLGRVFRSSDCVPGADGVRGEVLSSQYIAHLGHKGPFCRGMDELLDSFGGTALGERLVFINDGAEWIANWIRDIFPGATDILDYYHACEHLHEFVRLVFPGRDEGNAWATEQKNRLLESEVNGVIDAVASIPCHHKAAREARDALLNYYRNNAHRMDYARYRGIGSGIIGSGAIESAHRTIIQKRLKQSGQRWGKDGAQNVINLRVINQSGKWHKVIQNIKNAAAKGYQRKSAA